jgi:hypothetical protein
MRAHDAHRYYSCIMAQLHVQSDRPSLLHLPRACLDLFINLMVVQCSAFANLWRQRKFEVQDFRWSTGSHIFWTSRVFLIDLLKQKLYACILYPYCPFSIEIFIQPPKFEFVAVKQICIPRFLSDIKLEQKFSSQVRSR